MITDLDTGGAEMMLFKLLSALDRDRFSCYVVSLATPGVLGMKIKQLGIKVDALVLNPQFPNPWAVIKGVRLMRQWRPHIVQTWMYHADLLGTLVWLGSRTGALIWNMRCTGVDFSQYSRTTRWIMKTCAVLSRIPDKVVANSPASIAYHRKMGYRMKKSVVIPNGFDLSHFKPDAGLRGEMRNRLQIPEEAPCVGLVARFDPMKDHSTFFSAAMIIGKTRPDVHFVLCGEGINWTNPRLMACIHTVDTPLKIHLLNRRQDIERIMAGLDILVLSSAYGESFPNVVGEAMVSGVPCVVTDVGDSARIVGDSGKVVPPSDPHAMAHAVLDILDLPSDERQWLSHSARRRIQTNYSLDKVVEEYEKLYLESAR